MAAGSDSLSAFHDDILDRGVVFTVLFYFLVTALSLSVATALYQGLADSNLLAFSYALLFGGMTAYFFRQQSLYPLLVVAVFPIYAITLVLSFQSLPALVASVGAPGTYLVAGIVALLLGAVPAYLFRDISPGALYYLTIAVYGSSVIAILSAMLTALTMVMRTLQSTTQTPQIVFGGAQSLASVATMLNPSLLFAIVFVMFNAPFLIYAWEHDDFEMKLLPLYLGPLILYVLIQVSVSIVVGRSAV
ncbi:MAG: hypothetical protein SVW77_01675 [Candidatus Nanohaloarchaea archaeon]|nr:hypothetical protein [Candidatus Nanohaloarchaea archaeon]